jgi:hypothetical protein
LDSATGLLTILILLLTFLVIALGTPLLRRNRRIALREQVAFAALPLLVSEAIESDRPLHFSFGSAAPGGATTPLLLANIEMITLLATQAAIGARQPLITMSEALSIPVGYDVLRRAYRARNQESKVKLRNVQWYPDAARSLAFAGAVSSVIVEERVSTNVLTGSFGPELALIMDTAARRRQTVIAASDQLEGQAVAFAMSDYPLIGEEMFAGGAYLGQRAAQVGGILAVDVLRFLLVLTIIGLAIESQLGIVRSLLQQLVAQGS